MPMLDADLPTTDSELLERQWLGIRGSLSARKKAAQERRLVLDSRFASQVVDHVFNTHHHPEMRRLIVPHVSVGVNVAEDITNALAVVYRQGAFRTLSKGSDAKKDALASMYDEAAFSLLGPKINQQCFFVGPVLEVPNVRNGRRTSDIFASDKVDLVQDPDDLLGQPIKAAYPWWHPEHGEIVIVLDAESWRFFKDGDQRPFDEKPHGVGEFPGTLWRGELPTDPMDYWVAERNARLHRVTVEVAFINTLMDWVRKDQNRHILSLFGNLAELPKQQLIEPGVPWVMNVDQTDTNPEFNVQNAAVDPEMFIKHMMFKFRNVAESYGVPQSAVTFDFEGNQPAVMLKISHERLSGLRNAQVPLYRESEKSSAWKGVAMARSLGHPKANKLPTVNQVKESFAFHLPELNRVDEPKEAREDHDWKKAHGFESDVDWVLRRFPGMARKEAMKWLMDRHKEQAEINDFVTTRNMGTSPDGNAETAAQAFGRQGPRVRDGEQGSDELNQ